MDNQDLQAKDQAVPATKADSRSNVSDTQATSTNSQVDKPPTQSNNPPSHQYPQHDFNIQMTSQQMPTFVQATSAPNNNVQQTNLSQQSIHQAMTSQQSSPTATSIVETTQQSSQQHVVAMPPPIKPLLESYSPSESNNNPQAPSPIHNQTPNLSPQKAIITKVKLSDELNLLDWFRTTDIINQIAEKAKSSVDSVITILDPGMKEYLYSGGNVNIMVMCDSNCPISPVRDAFQSVFGRATVTPARYNPPNISIDHPIRLAIGFERAVMVAREKIKKLRLDTNNVPQNQVITIVQPSLVTLSTGNSKVKDGSQQDDILPRWFLTYCMLLEDPVLSLTINCYSQFIPLDDDIVTIATQESIYPTDFNDRHLGYSVSIDQLMSAKLHITEDASNGSYDSFGCAWLPKWSGNTETELIHQLSLSLANAYRRKWTDCVQIETLS